MSVNVMNKDWTDLPGGSYVSSNRMGYNSTDHNHSSGLFSLYSAANMDIDEFNKEAKKYDVIPLTDSDFPLDRLVRRSIMRSRKDNDGSFIPNNAQYVDMALKTAAAKAKYDGFVASGVHAEAEKLKPLADFYRTLKDGPADAVAEILKFNELLKAGPHKGKYLADRYVFNHDGLLELADERLVIALQGWTRVIGRSGYAMETSKDECSIEGIENADLQGNDVKGYHYVGADPVGEERIILRGPRWFGGSLLGGSVHEGRSSSYGYVCALRMRGEKK